jgi:hypothetical protein
MQENAMTATNATLAEAAETLYQTATRLQRVGLIVDRRGLSPELRRAAFALQCLAARCPELDKAKRTPMIGFAYPSAGTPVRPRHPTPTQVSAQRTTESV